MKLMEWQALDDNTAGDELNGTRDNHTQHNSLILIATTFICSRAEFHCTKCRYAECHYAGCF
jgi:hypothetical protein